MSDIEVNRGIEVDILFRLRQKQGGSLTDDDQWVDGATAAEWPVVAFLTSAGGDVTDQWVKDITGDTVTPWLKHPNATTGTIREAKGEYRSRVKPSNSLATGTYKMKVTADIGGAPYVEEHDIVLKLPGDVEFGSEAVYATEAQVLSNFELEGVVTTDQITEARINADRAIHSRLEADAISTPQALRPALTSAAVAFARGELRRLNSAVSGVGLDIATAKEGDAEYRFVSPDKQFAALYNEFERWMDMAVMAILGGPVYIHRSGMGNVDRD